MFSKTIYIQAGKVGSSMSQQALLIGQQNQFFEFLIALTRLLSRQHTTIDDDVICFLSLLQDFIVKHWFNYSYYLYCEHWQAYSAFSLPPIALFSFLVEVENIVYPISERVYNNIPKENVNLNELLKSIVLFVKSSLIQLPKIIESTVLILNKRVPSPSEIFLNFK